MWKIRPKVIAFIAGIASIGVSTGVHGQVPQDSSVKSDKPVSAKVLNPRNAPTSKAPEGQVIGKRIRFADGFSLDADDVWKQGDDLWYRRGNTSYRIDKEVRSIESIVREEATKPPTDAQVKGRDKGLVAQPKQLSTWIYLVGGARVRVDEVIEKETGAWYRRGNLSIFLDRERIARIERDQPEVRQAGWKQRGWTSGDPKLDQLISMNGARFGVDPYLIFCVIEQESQFHVRAVSPKGARGLMQLMPGTMARYGIRSPFNPAANIQGGTQYLRELMGMFAGRVNLVLASYNAGEGAVIKYGRRVPPYRETQNYVNRVSRRYGMP
jgi:hypothetical protein